MPLHVRVQTTILLIPRSDTEVAEEAADESIAPESRNEEMTRGRNAGEKTKTQIMKHVRVLVILDPPSLPITD